MERWFPNWKPILVAALLAVVLAAWLKPALEAAPKKVTRWWRMSRARRGKYVENLTVGEMEDLTGRVPVARLHPRFQADLAELARLQDEARRLGE